MEVVVFAVLVSAARTQRLRSFVVDVVVGNDFVAVVVGNDFVVVDFVVGNDFVVVDVVAAAAQS